MVVNNWIYMIGWVKFIIYLPMNTSHKKYYDLKINNVNNKRSINPK